MNCCCCGSASPRSDETIALVRQVPKSGKEIALPMVHFTGVSALFEMKTNACSTTPVPSLGSYGVPFPAVKSVHIIQDNETTLKIITFQYKPSDAAEASINLHHVLFPNYRTKGDPGEKRAGVVVISDIKVDGVKQEDFLKQKVYVHDGLFSPKLAALVTDMGNEPVTVSATINVPTPIYESQNHLYAGIKQIKMLNVMCSENAISFIDDRHTLEQINEIIDGRVSSQINDFVSDNVRLEGF